MSVQLKKVAGGYKLFIPDEPAASAGLVEGARVEAAVLAERSHVWQPEFVEAARAAQYAGLTPESFHREPDEWSRAVV